MATYGINGVIGGGSAKDSAVERHILGFQAVYARRGIKLNSADGLRRCFLTLRCKTPSYVV